MPIHFRTKDHPEVNGRKPQDGEHAWTFKFPLENGDDLLIHMGDEGLANFRQVVLDQMIDEKTDPDYDK